MNSKLFGGILLVVGTTIGAGMLALPVATAELGFLGSVILLIGCWALMVACAFLFLEVNLWLPPNSNLISMAGKTLGKPGQLATWVVYLALLYSISCAYIAGGGDVFHYILNAHGLPISSGGSSLLFTLLFGVVVYCGIRAVDYVNRGLMVGKFGTYLILVLLILPFISAQNLSGGQMHQLMSSSSISITVVAFGCIMIIPSLRTYFNEDIPALRKAIFIGMLIPLLCYIAWDMVIMGVIPLDGAPGLKQMMHSSGSNSAMLHALTFLLQKDSVNVLANFFTSICMATSFLSVSLSLSDFLADGLKVRKQGSGNLLIYALTFAPSLLIVLFYPDAFLRSLNYAGISCLILMMLLPPLMVWRGRYHHELVHEEYQMVGGKPLLLMLITIAIVMIGLSIKTVS